MDYCNIDILACKAHPSWQHEKDHKLYFKEHMQARCTHLGMRYVCKGPLKLLVMRSVRHNQAVCRELPPPLSPPCRSRVRDGLFELASSSAAFSPSSSSSSSSSPSCIEALHCVCASPRLTDDGRKSEPGMDFSAAAANSTADASSREVATLMLTRHCCAASCGLFPSANLDCRRPSSGGDGTSPNKWLHTVISALLRGRRCAGTHHIATIATGACCMKMKNWPTPKTPRKDANVVVSANAQSAATQPTTTQSAHTALALRNVAPNASSAAPPAMVPNTPVTTDMAPNAMSAFSAPASPLSSKNSWRPACGPQYA
mmetsp:Transcript_26818/g.79639  ORF Transcript_26818/g.79639 Transcript_26818/m.79639 type:complete len:315 (-) Transcript_26818:700-1644(-)